jgi:uncharacterized protein YkwD
MWSTLALLASLATVEPQAPVGGRCPDGWVWTTSFDEQAEMLVLLNQARLAQRLPPLVRVAVLDRMAMAHAADMACRSYFSHGNPEGESLEDRYARAAGDEASDWLRLAEILGTSPTAPLQLQGWLDSPSHRKALLEPAHNGAGIGLVRIARGSRTVAFWAVEFTGK